MNKKQVIRLTESQFHQIIKESVKKILKEESINSVTFKDAQQAFMVVDYNMYRNNPPRLFAYGVVPVALIHKYNQNAHADRDKVVYAFKTEQEYNNFIQQAQAQGGTVEYKQAHQYGFD